MPKPTLLHRVAAAIAAFYLHLVGRTSFVETWDHPSYLPFRRERRPMIFGFWHNTQVFLSYHHRHEPTINIMVSQSKDGEYIARVMDWMGMRAIRGSSSRGGLRAFVDIMQRAEAGEQIGFTPDGPRGPAHSVQDGIVVAAKRSGLPIVPLHTLSRRRMTFKTWDQFMVPLPFSHMIVSHGRPFRLTESDSDDVAKEKVKAFLEKNQMVCEEALESAPSYLVSVYAYVLLCFYNVALTFLFPVVVLSLMLKFGFKRSLSGIGDRLGLSKPSVHGKKRSWFHAASLGEWQALKPLMAGFDDASVLITTSSPEARDLIRSEKPGADVFLMPMDVLWIIRPWIKRWTPEALYIVETELWPNMIETCSKRYIPIFVVNGRLSQKSVAGWRRAGALMTRMLRRVSRFYVRTQEDADRFALLGAPRHRIEITGNLKVDQLRTVSTSDKASIRRGLFGDTNGVIVVAGSTWTGEEKMVLDAFKKAAPSSMRLIIAPRRKDRFNEVDALLRKEGVSFDRWSKIKAAGSWTSPILLVDTLGDLKKMYEAADLAFVGGTLVKRGGQNPLEAAACGVPVVFGPSMENFAEEARTLVACGAAVQKETTVDVVEAIVQLLNDPERRHLMGGKAIDAVKRSQGVAEKILSSLKDEMSIHK